VHGERHPDVAASFSNIANVLRKQGQHDEAFEMHKKALKIQRRALGKNHKDVAYSLFKVGDILSAQGKYDEAVEMFDKALAIYTRALGIDNRENAGVHSCIALAKHRSGDRAGALESARESVRIFNKHGVNDAESQAALDQLIQFRRLEGEA
jgi:serine/threonine-protein kinase